MLAIVHVPHSIFVHCTWYLYSVESNLVLNFLLLYEDHNIFMVLNCHEICKLICLNEIYDDIYVKTHIVNLIDSDPRV